MLVLILRRCVGLRLGCLRVWLMGITVVVCLVRRRRSWSRIWVWVVRVVLLLGVWRIRLVLRVLRLRLIRRVLLRLWRCIWLVRRCARGSVRWLLRVGLRCFLRRVCLFSSRVSVVCRRMVVASLSRLWPRVRVGVWGWVWLRWSGFLTRVVMVIACWLWCGVALLTRMG